MLRRLHLVSLIVVVPFAKVLAKEYPEIKKISIDFALLEHAQNVVAAAGDFEWDDLGSWNAMAWLSTVVEIDTWAWAWPTPACGRMAVAIRNPSLA
jgi:hypothetical protein